MRLWGREVYRAARAMNQQNSRVLRKQQGFAKQMRYRSTTTHNDANEATGYSSDLKSCTMGRPRGRGKCMMEGRGGSFWTGEVDDGRSRFPAKAR